MKKIVYVFLFMLLFVACEQELENQEANLPEANLPKTDLSGKWTVNAHIDNDLIFGPFTITTQMSPESEAIYINDNGEFWNFKVEAEILNASDKFEAKSSVNELCSLEAAVKILDGAVINNDSIAFYIQFEDDETPYGLNYKISGRRKE